MDDRLERNDESWNLKDLQPEVSGMSAAGTVNTVTLTQSCSTQLQMYMAAMSKLDQVASTFALLSPSRFQQALQWLDQVEVDCRTGAWETQAVCHSQAQEIPPDLVHQDDVEPSVKDEPNKAVDQEQIGNGLFEVKIKAVSSDKTGQPHDGKPRPFLCTVCSKRFTMKWYLDKHKRVLHFGEKSYPCTQCEKVFTTECEVNEHMIVHSSEYKCGECGKCFSNSLALTEHEKVHTGEKAFQCFVRIERSAALDELAEHSRIRSTTQKLYKCHMCEKTFRQPQNLKNHSRAHLEEFKCLLCDKNLSDPIVFQRHRRLGHDYKCLLCDKAFVWPALLHRHMLVHKEDKPSCEIHKTSGLNRCYVCDKVFRWPEALTRHSKIHMGHKPHKCLLCDRTFSESYKLKKHIDKHAEHNYKCSLCDKTFIRPVHLYSHMIIHEEDKPSMSSLCDKTVGESVEIPVPSVSSLCDNGAYESCEIPVGERSERDNTCHLCHKVFRWPSSLRRHKRVHTGEKPYTCLTCGKSFGESGHLLQHKRAVHNNQMPYGCQYCGMLFKNKSRLNCHVHNVHTTKKAKPFSCKHCAECFTCRRQLDVHLRKSHDEGYTCHICGKKYGQKGHLQEHLLRHEGVKPYICSECPKCFCTPRELKRHQPVHSDVKLFRCEMCDKCFKQKEFIIKHMARHFKVKRRHMHRLPQNLL